AEKNLQFLAQEKASWRVNIGQTQRTLPEECDYQLEELQKTFDKLGELAFSFDSGTAPAVKQMREKLLLAAAGSMNLELDEVGSNLSANTDVLNAFLELYDVGLIKQKLIKNTQESIRSEELPGSTPTNLMMFGTPTKLLDGGKIEEEFKEWLETGYARRLLFGYTTETHRTKYASAEERYQQMIDPDIANEMEDIQETFASFAKRSVNTILQISKENHIHLLEYQMRSEEAADDMKDHMTIQQA
ncbi:uncharacterized protein METZ01_LOCUS476559, partial [marine metagenome]